jgi:2-dehydro-3-deoxyphosphooctonate aldolase (KDO 8-P synthase)
MVNVHNFEIGDNKGLVLIAGPCVIESKEHCLYMAKELKRITTELGIPFIFKASFDKANRSSHTSYRGPGFEQGIQILREIKQELNIPILSDIHETNQITKAKEVLDIMQIPAFLCRQTDLLLETAKSGTIVNIKKGQFLAPWDIKNIINKIESTGNKNIIITERGTSFGYNNLVSDMRSLVVMKQHGYPIIFDATHSVQLPGGKGTSTDGQREFVFPLMKAATGVGIDGLYIEVHNNPDNAPCDGPNMLKLDGLKEKLEKIIKINNIVKDNN